MCIHLYVCMHADSYVKTSIVQQSLCSQLVAILHSRADGDSLAHMHFLDKEEDERAIQARGRSSQANLGKGGLAGDLCCPETTGSPPLILKIPMHFINVSFFPSLKAVCMQYFGNHSNVTLTN